MPKSYADLLREARARIREVSPQEVEALPAGEATIVDVREASEWEQGHLPGAHHVSKSYIEQQIEAAAPDRDAPVILYCAAGVRSLFAGQTLAEMGYTNVASMSGGFQAWKGAGFDFETPVVLSPEQKQRYSRHLLIPEVGSSGQKRLLESKALLIGAGGLGSPAALYLAAAGVGTIGLVDFDVVDVSNLQRQILHTTDRVGERKVESARIAINALNPDVNVIQHEEMLTADNVERLIDGYDVILDGTDTFETRYVLNDAAVAAGTPVVHASVFRFEGQLTTFIPFEGPCYRCLYPTPPPPELAPGCSVAGVLGVVPGILGLLQTNEALKVLLGIGTTLAGRLVLFDALETEFTELQLRRDPNCPTCSDAAAEARKAGRPLTTVNVGEDAPFLLSTTGLAGSVSPEARA
ncbi:MAG TPA: molybdopterin-synthase adenylyltransferase MoeB [Candidatus Limnocylindrales bacterium]|jgi:molybdopterin/thiamine biosynthesis adenylyltransferase/rhodanese-related sulfurtransferase|nr:molybdopterin-synthase adenylyltransferase MoeB [Candidatus Limnocylindrales bacterium]